MAGNKSIALFLLSLAFLFLLTAPLALVFGHYSGIVQLPSFITYRNVSAAATAGLFIIPVLMVFLAAIVVAVKKRRLAIPSAAVAKPAKREQVGSSRNSANSGMRNRAMLDLRLLSPAEAGLEPVRYPWEGMFGREEKAQVERRRPVSRQSAAGFKPRVAAVVVIAAVVLALLVALQQKAADVPAINKTLEEKPADEVKPQRSISSVLPSAIAKKVVDSARGFAGKIKGKFVGSVSKVKSAVAKVPGAAWQDISIAAVALLLVGTVFYSHRAGQLGGILKWSVEWLGWLLGIFSYLRKHKLKVLLWIIAAAAAFAVIAAVVFRKWVVAKFPAVSASGLIDVAVNALLAVKDFVSVYRIYIAIGIFALLAIIGILVALEKRGKG